jgi:hypothetical protein
MSFTPLFSVLTPDYFSSRSCQLSTTVKGAWELRSTGTATRKRLASAVTSHGVGPVGNLNIGVGVPAWNAALAVTSTAMIVPSGDE